MSTFKLIELIAGCYAVLAYLFAITRRQVADAGGADTRDPLDVLPGIDGRTRLSIASVLGRKYGDPIILSDGGLFEATPTCCVYCGSKRTQPGAANCRNCGAP